MQAIIAFTYIIKLGLAYVDLYLIHSPALANPDIPTVWAQMEKVKQDGFAKYVVITMLVAI